MTRTRCPSGAGRSRTHAYQGGLQGSYYADMVWCGMPAARAIALLAPTHRPADCKRCLASMTKWERHYGKRLRRPAGERSGQTWTR